ncbi:MAG: sigma-54-dependent transcriptional regulator [Lishizhenia sp.]
MYQSKVLIISEEHEVLKPLKHFLERKGFLVRTATQLSLLEIQNQNIKFDLIIADLRLNESQTKFTLSQLKIEYSYLPILLLTYFQEVNYAAALIQKEVFGYMLHPVVPEEMWLYINEALGEDKIIRPKLERLTAPIFFFTKESNPLEANKAYRFSTSIPSKNVKKLCETFAPKDLNLLLVGDNGVGKSSLARTLHNHSKKVNETFVHVNCGVLSKDEEWQVFNDVIDKVTNGGTLFFNQISQLSYTNQKKLLKFFELNNKANEIGERPFRIIVAENKHLIHSVKEGRFNEDLFHTIHQANIYVPALKSDVDGLLFHSNRFIQEANQRFKKSVEGLTSSAISLIKNYNWPGNLSELRLVMFKAVLNCIGNKVDLKSLPQEISEKQGNQSSLTHIASLTLKEATERAESEFILKILKQTRQNKSKAAAILGVDRKTLYNKMAAYHLLD